MAEEKNFSTTLTKVNEVYFPLIKQQLTGNGIDMNEYSKKCVLNAISSINNMLDVSGVTWNDKQLDQSNITQTLLTVASLQLNPSASPNEIYFQLRNVQIKKRDDSGKEIKEWKKQIEFGIEGDGNDAILSRFGRNVKEVRQHWLVRSEDRFEYPTYNGLELDPPKWTPTGKGKVVRVVYPIIKTSGIVEYHIAERDDVVKNLIAHVNNNLMNETFGIAENRFKANAKQKDEINKKKQEILNKIKDMGLDAALEDEELQKYISPAWKDPQSKESMIIRKMRNNIVKKIPKDFGSSFAGLIYDQAANDTSGIKQEVSENANKEIIDIEYEEQEEEHQEQDEQQEGKQQQEKEPVFNVPGNISDNEVPF